MNMFPLTVQLPSGQSFASCRLISDGRDFTVWHHDGAEFVIVAEGRSSSIAGTGPTWYVKTDDGTTTITRQDGCGCGHPLKRYTPSADGAVSARRVYTDPVVTDAL